MDKLKFQWKYFVGTGLKVKYRNVIGVFLYIKDSNIYIKEKNGNEIFFNVNSEDVVKPLLINTKNLSDDNFKYIFEHPWFYNNDINIHRTDIEIAICYKGNCYCNIRLSDGAFLFSGTLVFDIKQILERFYSINSIPNYQELFDVCIIEDAGGCYE